MAKLYAKWHLEIGKKFRIFAADNSRLIPEVMISLAKQKGREFVGGAQLGC